MKARQAGGVAGYDRAPLREPPHRRRRERLPGVRPAGPGLDPHARTSATRPAASSSARKSRSAVRDAAAATFWSADAVQDQGGRGDAAAHLLGLERRQGLDGRRTTPAWTFVASALAGPVQALRAARPERAGPSVEGRAVPGVPASAAAGAGPDAVRPRFLSGGRPPDPAPGWRRRRRRPRRFDSPDARPVHRMEAIPLPTHIQLHPADAGSRADRRPSSPAPAANGRRRAAGRPPACHALVSARQGRRWISSRPWCWRVLAAAGRRCWPRWSSS